MGNTSSPLPVEVTFESLVLEVGDELVASDWFVFDDQYVVLLFCHGSLSCWNASKLLI